MKCKFKGSFLQCNLLGCKYLCTKNCRYRIAYEQGDNVYKSFCEYMAFEHDNSDCKKPVFSDYLKLIKIR